MEVFLNRVSQPRSEVRALYVVMGEAIGAVPEVSEEVADFTERTVRSVARLIKEGVKCGELRSDLMLERVIEPELKYVGVKGVTLAYWERTARRDDLPTLLFGSIGCISLGRGYFLAPLEPSHLIPPVRLAI